MSRIFPSSAMESLEQAKSIIFTNDDTYNISSVYPLLKLKKNIHLDVYQYVEKKPYGIFVLRNDKPFPAGIVFDRYRLLFKNEFVSTFVLNN